MLIREAKVGDIRQMFEVRYSVKENILYESDGVDDQVCESYLTERGKGWVCEIDSQIVGFAIADLKENSIWALFVKPEFERRGIGRNLQMIMLDWYFSQSKNTAWLVTNSKTRAEQFYRKSGWKEVVTHGDGEIKFEMTYEDWLRTRKKYEL